MVGALFSMIRKGIFVTDGSKGQRQYGMIDLALMLESLSLAYRAMRRHTQPSYCDH